MFEREVNPDRITQADVAVVIPSYEEADSIAYPTKVVSQGLRKYFPEKTIMLFGVDMNCNRDAREHKWYDRHTDKDQVARGKLDVQSKLAECAEQLISFVSPEGIFNCNLQSALNHFERIEWASLVAPATDLEGRVSGSMVDGDAPRKRRLTD